MLRVTTESGISSKKALLLVIVLAFCTLMFELILSRMAAFYLNYASSFIAIPLTLFGLAIGSLRVHLGKKSPEDIPISRNLLLLTVVSFLSFALVFLLFSKYTPLAFLIHSGRSAEFLRITTFVLVFLPPFYFVGKILTALYSSFRQIIGKLYGFDLIGAALACFLTPILFHFIDLPYLIFICFAALTLVTAISFSVKRIVIVGIFVAANILLLPILVFLDGSYNMAMSLTSRGQPLLQVTELAHRWNEFSRVSLIRITKENRTPYLKIIHDTGESNVIVKEYKTSESTIGRNYEINAPFLLDRPTSDIMVMFAGAGAQMITFNGLTHGKSNIVGVEINPLIREFAENSPELKSFNLKEFYNRPNIDYRTEEGRSFLDNDNNKYDVIYLGSSAATFKYQSGHSRKYLDTKEAMASYFDHLKSNGLLISRCGPATNIINSFKSLFNERGIKDFYRHIIVGGDSLDKCAHLILSKKPFTKSERKKLEKYYSKKMTIQYLFGFNKNTHKAKRLITWPLSPDARLVTDERPFLWTLDFKKYSIFPGMKKLKGMSYYRSWIKITTMIVVLILLVVIVVLLYLKKANMPPASMMAYLVLTGFCYMLVEITFIGKLELFLENPLYSMSLLLSIFLLTNAAGSILYGKYKEKLNMTLMPLIAGGIVILSMVVSNAIIQNRLGLPLPIKIIITILVTSPVGICLGLFYPFVVSWLDRNNKVKTIPITYGISTLSSVAGATYAMTMMVNWGYSSMFYQAAAGYGLLTVFMAAMTRLRRD